MKKRFVRKSLSVTLAVALSVGGLLSMGVVTSEAKSKEPIEIPEPVKIIEFGEGFEKLATQDSKFEIVKNEAEAPSIVYDEDIKSNVLKLGKSKVVGTRYDATVTADVDDYDCSTLKFTNPFVGNEALVEYEDYEDPVTKINRNKVQPDWKTGISISYWVKCPTDPNSKNGFGLNSNIVGFQTERFQMQADDYAKYLCTVKFDVDYNKYSEEEKKALGFNESGVLPNSDFYFEYAEQGEKSIAGFTGPVYADESYMGRIYWVNKFYKPGFIKKGENNYSKSSSLSDYYGWCEAPRLGLTKEDYDCGKSQIRFAWTYSEMWFDAATSVFFENDNKTDSNLNINVQDNLLIRGMQNGDEFCINPWIGGMNIEEAAQVGTNPVTHPDEWHFVTTVVQNDWIKWYVDGEEVEIEGNYSSYGGNGLCPTGKVWKRFNKGTGARYGYGCGKDIYWCYYGNFVCSTIMQVLSNQSTEMTIGGEARNGNGYNCYATTDNVLVKNVVFYDKMLSDDAIEALAEDPDYWNHSSEATPTPGVDDTPEPSTPPINEKMGDVDNDGNVTANDALVILKYAANLMDLNDSEKKVADLDNDTVINANDALSVLKLAAGL